MKRTLTAIVLAAAISPGYAVDIVDTCTKAGETAELIMDTRYHVPMSDMMRSVKESGADKKGVEWGYMMVRKAFRSPNYHTEEMRLKATKDFRDWAEGVCFDALLKASQ